MKKGNLCSMFSTAGIIIGAGMIAIGFITDYGNGRFKEGLELGEMAGRAERDIEYFKRKPEKTEETNENDD